MSEQGHLAADDGRPPRGSRQQADTHLDRAFVIRPSSVIVIGYGNELRGDDAAGPRVAEVVASWHLEGVRAIARHQLTPELAAVLAQARFALFVDAHRDTGELDGVHMRPVSPASGSGAALSAHLGDPSALLALTQAAYGRAPASWWITVPAVEFDFGAGLSRVARSAIGIALQLIRHQLAALKHVPEQPES